MKTYDPNISWAKHTIEITYQRWEYLLTANVSIYGNTQGKSILESAVGIHADKLFKEQGEFPVLMLKRTLDTSGEVEELEVTLGGDDSDIEDDLGSMCVGLRIVGHEMEVRK